ncbi:MAG: FHA domain-containing protein [Victivallaceae bacterium]|nr:FHA domain-containing protein [Victivallaceae bacterium]
MKIYFLNGEMSGVKVKLEDITTLGRDESNSLPITGLGISRHHATFAFKDNVWKIIDGGSTNGSRVNHERVDGEQELQEGDIIELGNQTIRFGEPRDLTSSAAAASNVSDVPVIKPGRDTVQLDQQLVPGGSSNKIIFQPHQSGKPPAGKVELKIKGSSPIAQKSLKETKKLPPKETVPSGMLDGGVKKKSHSASSKATGPVESKELSEALKNGKISLFKPTGQQDGSNNNSPEKPKKRRFSNLLFYVVVLFIAFIVIVVFLKINENGYKPVTTAKPVKKIPKLFLLIYEKTKLSPDNIFRFFMKVEDRKAYFSIDDLKSQRSYEKTVEITQYQLDDLKHEIEQAEIMGDIAPPAGSATNELDETKRLIVSYDGQLKDIKIINNAMPVSFIKITDIINNFVEHYGLQTIALTPEELKEKAKELFNKAELLFHNRAGNPANLRKAVVRYKMAEDFLSQFSPKPPMWSKAKKQAGIAEDLRRKRLKELKNDELKYNKLGEYEKRDEVLTEMMQLCLPESKPYLAIRKAKIDNDEKIRSLNRR